MRNFLNIYKVCDAKQKAAQKQFHSIADEALHANKCSYSATKENTSSFHPYNNRVSGSQNLNSSTTKCVRPPKLTNEERDIIRKFKGCFKCWKLLLPDDHTTNTCLDDFPSPDNYRPLTLDYANRMKQLHVTKQSKTAAAVVLTALPSSSSYLEVDSLGDSDFVASIFGPLAGSSVIGNGSLSEGDISVSPPFKSKHFVWKCTIDGPAAEFPLKFSSLIDNSCHLVLIHPDTVSRLGLPVLSLPEPEVVNIVISSSSSQPMSLSEYVEFKVTSLDGQWTSHKFFAIITPRLCMPLILGLPFL